MSARMKIPGNLWIDVWSSTSPIPATRQKRLFDDTWEAEKVSSVAFTYIVGMKKQTLIGLMSPSLQVLSWMSSRTLRDICQLIFPCLAHASTLKILDAADELKVSCKVPATIVQNLTQLTRCLGYDVLRTQSKKSVSNYSATADNDTLPQCDTNSYKIALLSSLAQIEREICQLRSFQQKFVEIDLNAILNRSSGEEEQRDCPVVPASPPPYLLPQYIKVEGGYGSPLRQRICDIFQKEGSVHDLAESEFNFGDPVKKVFVLKYVHGKSSAQTTESSLPQRMTCCVRKGELKVTGTFSIRTDLD